MFKLESYITPILLDYVSKYVKNIRPEDFQLSLWEGEVALHNLDLRLDVLQEELNLPVEFISGHIHDLSIKVPWTKITSEPIVIAINTIEFVLKLKNPSEDIGSASSSPQRIQEAKKKRRSSPKPEDSAPNQEASRSWLISKIINNITLQCHNIILKYVQEDIVVSMNIQLLSFESANENWQSSMIDVHPVKVLMRKVIKISDLTICLDNRNDAGHIDVCQEPILYRSSFECRILLKYNANDPGKNRITRIAVFTNLLDMNISSMQIPLFLRLVKVALALKDVSPAKTAAPDSVEEAVDEDDETPADQSYLAWAWNLLPSLNFTPGYEDEPTSEAPCHTIDLGFYGDQLSFTLKNAEFVQDTHMATKRIRYTPIVRLSIGGMYFEMVSAAARHWISFKAGVTSVCVEPLGAYKIASSNLIESEDPQDKRPFIDKSLFDNQCHSIADKGWGVTNYEEYTARITDDYLLYRSPVLAFDLIEYKAPTNNASTSNSSAESNDNPNRVQYRFLTAGLTFRYTQTLEQVKQLICEFINSYDYPAYYTESLDGGSIPTAGNGSKLPPPLMEDYDALMRHVPLCTKRFSMQRITIEIHPKGDLFESSAQKSHIRRSYSSGTIKSTAIPPHCVIYIASAVGSLNTPLQPDKLVHTTCQLPEKPEKLLQACYEHYELQIKDFSCNLKNADANRNARVFYVPRFEIAYGNLLQPQKWKDVNINFQRLNFQCEHFYFEFTRRELISLYYLMQCAHSHQPKAFRNLLRYEASNLAADDKTKLHTNLNRLQICWQRSVNENNWNMTLHGIDSHVLHRQRFDAPKKVIFSTAGKKNQPEQEKWLECNFQLPSAADEGNYGPNKTIVGVWLGSFSFKMDANLLHFLRCRTFEEIDHDALIDSSNQTQFINVPHFPSNASQQSQTSFVTTQTSIQPSHVPSLTRRSSRNSLQSRKISHPEETIHFSSEREEKLESYTLTSNSPKVMDSESNTQAWLTFIQSYILCIEIDSSIIHIAKNLESNAMSTKILLPRVLLKPSNLENIKYETLRQFMAAVATSKDKNDISWTLTLSDIGLVNEYENLSEALIEPLQTTVTIALIHKSEKLKVPTDIKDQEIECHYHVQNNKSPAIKDTSAARPLAPFAKITRSISPSGTSISSAASVTVGGRSNRSISDILTMEMQSQAHHILESPKLSTKPNFKKTWKSRDIYTFNLHVDTTPVRLLASSRKIRLFEEHLSILKQVVQLIRPKPQTNNGKEFEEDSIEIVTATEENTVLKEFMDLETSSNSSKFSEREKDSQLIISLFCQWTITRITLEVEANTLNYNNSKILIELEDLLSTIDQKEDYTKCTSKIGNFNVKYFEKNTSDEWKANDSLTIRLLGETTNLPFINVIYTSVGLKHFFKRIGAKRKGDLNKNLTEIIVTIQSLELILNLDKISKFATAISGFFDRYSREFNEREPPDGGGGGGGTNKMETHSKGMKVNTIAEADLPMIHLDSKGFTMYLPLDKGEEYCSVAIFRIESIKITPNLENPLQRKPLRSDIYAKAAQLGMLGTPGATIEDRQYELTLQNVSAASGSWRQILAHMSEQRDNFVRNPAFEWNNQNRKPDLHITDIFSNFSFITIYAPSIVFKNVLICGSNIEFNCATDFVASLNMNQINMLSCLIIDFQRILSSIQQTQGHNPVIMTKRTQCNQSNPNPNQANMLSTKVLNTSLQRYNSTTRDRNTSIFQSIDEQIEQNLPKTSDSGFQSSISQLPYGIEQQHQRPKDKFGSISTLSSAPLSKQLRRIPQTVSLVAGVFLIKFYDIETIQNDCRSDIFQNDCRNMCIPLFSITLSQPSFMFTQNVYDSLMQISLYDFFIYLSTSQPVGTVSQLVFNEIILDTRPGQASAAGIMPSLFSLRSHSTKMQLRDWDIEIAKPIALLLSERKVELLIHHILLINATLLENPCFEVRPKRNIIRGSKIKLMRQQCFDVDRLHFNCRSIVLRFQSEEETYNCKLVSSDMMFNIKFLNRPEKANVKASIGALYMLVDQKAILHPVNVRLSIDFISEPWHELPLITFIVKFNVLNLDLGINSVLHLKEAYEGYKRLKQDLDMQFREFLKNRPYEKNVHDLKSQNLELLKCPSVCDLNATTSIPSMQREEFYQDDLRAGAFQFVEMNTDSFLPMPYQIQIIKKNFGIICWRYPQPRKMSRIFVYPVPMAMPNPILIRCRMEYYSEVHETFLNFCDFSLSETVSNQVRLPERQICANIWRVVILQSLISVDGTCFDDVNSEEEDSRKSIASIKIDDVLNCNRKESDFILHPKVLVGCMRIDTTFESTCVPKIQFLLSCNFLTVKLLNQPNHGGILPDVLKKCKLSQTTQISQAFLIASLQNLNMHAGFISSDNYSIDSNMTCSVKCLDYGFLNMLPILEDVTLQSSVQVEMAPTTLQRDVCVKFVFDRLKLNFGPSIVHSLLTSKQHWEDFLQPNSFSLQKNALVPKCIVVNRTFNHLTFGQTGTTERIQLQNRECCLYSFRSPYHSQQLTFFITDIKTALTEASQSVHISFKYPGDVCVQPIRIGNKCLFIHFRKLSNIQIYILIKGQIELISMVAHDFRLDFRSDQKTERDKIPVEYLIESYERVCFDCVVQKSTEITMRLRFINDTCSEAPKMWSGDIPLRSNKNMPWLVKVPHVNAGFISLWVRVFREDIIELMTDNFRPQKILITIWPVFELCSMLSVPIGVFEESMGANFKLGPKGQSRALDVPATHLTDHRVKFHFNHATSQQSSHEFLLSLKMIDWKQFFWYDEYKWSIEDVLTTLSEGSTVKYPCEDEEELRVQRYVMEPKKPAIQYNCASSRELSCTLRLEISPWGYFINATSTTVSISAGEATPTERVIINSNATQMLPTIDKCFRVEVKGEENWFTSAPVFFEESDGARSKSFGQYYILSEKSHVDVVIIRKKEVIKFVLSLKVEKNRKILILRSKFVMANFTNHILCMLSFAMDHKETATREHVINLDNKFPKRILPPIESKDDCVGIALDTFHELQNQKSNFTIDTAFVCFVSLKICDESNVSIPIPLSLPFTRRCFSARKGNASIALAVTLIEKDGIYYLCVFKDTSPTLLVNNQTDLTYLIAQTNASENSKVINTTPEFMGRHFEWYQMLPSYSSCYYTPPEMYANFPDVDSTRCNLTIAVYKDNTTKKDIKWSKPIRTDKSWEKCLNIPNHGDVKVIICDKHRIIRVSIFYILQQKEFSVKDLRSRLLVTQPTLHHDASDESFISLQSQQKSSNNITFRSQSEAEQRCSHFPINKPSTMSQLSSKSNFIRTRYRLHAFGKEIILGLHIDDKERDYIKTEVLIAYLDDFMLVFEDASAHNQADSGRSLNLLCPNLQIDNQLHSTGKYDFPVIICAQELYQKTNFIPQAQYLEQFYQELRNQECMVKVALKFFDDEFSISDLMCSVNPVRAYIEDAFLNELLDALVECSPSSCVYIPKMETERIELNAGESLLPHDVVAQAICISEPLQLRFFRIEPLNILLSVHTSLRLYIALDHSPLSFLSYQRHQILTVPLRFGQSLGMHYLSGAIFGAGWVVGSLEILGSPSCLARSCSIGLRDFVSMPVQGLFRGPWGFIVGITQGSASLLRNVTAGTVNSLTKLAASVARNLDRLTLDREHIERTEALRRVRPSSVTEGFSQGMTGLGISILGAVGGLAHHTLEARSPVEVVAGVGKGLVGALTKPISGAAELVALTGQGVLQTVGFNALPLQRMASNMHGTIIEPAAYRIWKLLPGMLVTDQVLFYHEITLAIQNQMRGAYVCLTSTIFAILVTQCDKLEIAYPVSKVELTRNREDKTLFYVQLTKDEVNEIEDNLSYTNERIMSFLRSSHSIRDSTRMSTNSLQELLQGSANEVHDILPQKNLDWAFYINEHLGEHLLQYLKILRNEI